MAKELDVATIPESESQAAPLMLSVSGCRGVFGASLTPVVAARFAGALAGALAEEHGERPRVIVGRDGRAGGEAIHSAALAGLLAGGADAIDLDVAMTASVGVMVDHLEAAGGLVITASHNPQEWTGLKPIVRAPTASAPAKERADELIQRFRAERTRLVDWSGAGHLERRRDAATIHMQRVLAALEKAGFDVERIRRRQFRVVLDSVNASGRVGGSDLLGELGCGFTHLNDGTSGLFPHPPEPVESHLTELAEHVRGCGADAGFAQDPDADRLAIIDEHGRYIGEEHTLALAARALLERAGAADAHLVANLSTSRMIDDVAAAHGATVARAAVGEANVVSAMRRTGALIGGEGNGGVIWPEVVWIRDSLSAMGLVLGLLAERQQTLSDIVAESPTYAIRKRKVELAEGMAARAVEAVADRWSDQTVDRQDGVRVDFGDERAWLHVRPSNTEPILRLISEAPEAARAEAILEEAESLIQR